MGQFLVQMKELVPWEEIERKCIELRLYKPSRGQQGRPSYPCQVLVGSLFLQSWYGLSDPQTEELILTMPLFRAFLGIKVGGKVSDETTICKFRNKMVSKRLMKWVFELVQSKME